MGFLKKFLGKNDTAEKKSSGTRTFRLYLLDDDEMVCKIFSHYYNKFSAINPFYAKDIHFDINTFSESDQLLDAILTNQPDLLVLDYYLSSSDNYHTTEQLREKILGHYPEMKIAIMSSMDDGHKVLGLIKKGVRDYIIKDNNMYQNLDEVILSMLD